MLIAIYFYYKLSKILRDCVTYSKKKQLDILGFVASSEILLLSNMFFLFKLLKFNNSNSAKDAVQSSFLVSSRNEFLKALTIMLLGQTIFWGATYAH